MRRAYVIPESARAIYDDLKKNYHPKVGEYFFFDLSVPDYKSQLFYNMDEIEDLQHTVTPNAIICYDAQEGFPVLAYNCESFSSEENLSTNEIMRFSDNGPIDMEQVKTELQQLMKLLNSKAC